MPSNNEAELRRAIVNYRVMCDIALSDRDEGVVTQKEYERAINNQLDVLLDVFKAHNRQLLEAILEGAETQGRIGADGIRVDTQYVPVAHIKKLLTEEG